MLFADLPPPPPPAPATEGAAEPGAAKGPENVRGMVKDQDFIIWSLVFAGILLVAAVVFYFFDRWRKKPATDSGRDLSMSLSSFREMYENGEITEAEYEKIKAKWAAKLKEKVGSAAPPAAPPPDPTSPPPYQNGLPFPLGMPAVPPPPPPPPPTRPPAE